MSFLARIFLILLPVLIFIFYGKVLLIDDKKSNDYFEPKEFPVFQLNNFDGIPANLDIMSGVKLLNVWASWCITCLVEHPFLSKLAESQIEIIGLNYKDDKTKALDWLKRHGNPYTSLIYDPRGDLAFDLGVTGAPETFLIVDQKIVGHIQGELNEDKWKSTFLPIIQNSQKELN
tara:strand:+ start:692 stop:1216 length:525 start_codon:yes stop_codon:yes gene_type:complete